MSNVIDERVVQMKFDNAQFEEGIGQSIKSMNKFQKTIDSFQNSSAMIALSNGIQEAGQQFSAMSIVAITALSRITNEAINAGTRIAKALTIDPLKSGFSEYQEQLDSTMVIMSNTGDSLETVTEALDELNVYADKTVYSFGQMTNAIGKFAAAGVNLDDSVAAIKGLSNAAALVGANNSQLYSAYYNLSQSLQMGYLQTIDYNSLANSTIFNKNMRDLVIETAIEMGVFAENSEMAAEAYSDFKGSLQKKWVTSDIILATLEKYSNATTDIGKKATQAATELKSFKQLVDTVLESIGTGWADSFKLIVGDLDESRAFWTQLGTAITDVVENISKGRLKLLKDWRKYFGRDELIGGFFDSIDSIKSRLIPIKEAFRDMFPKTTGIQLAQFTSLLRSFNKSLKLTETESLGLKNIVTQLLKPVKSLYLFMQDLAGGLYYVGAGISIMVRRFLDMSSSAAKFKNVMAIVFGRNRYFSIIYSWNKVLNNVNKSVAQLKDEWAKFKDEIKGSEAVNEFLERFNRSLRTINEKVLDTIVKFFERLAEITSKIDFSGVSKEWLQMAENIAKGSNIISAILDNTLGLLFDVVTDVEGLLDAGKVINAATTFFTVKFIGGLTSAIAGFAKAYIKFNKTGMSFTKTINKIYKAIGNYINAKAFDIFAKSTIKIAGAIAILAGALTLLASLDYGKLWSAVGAITALTGVLVGTVALFWNMSTKLSKTMSSGFKLGTIIQNVTSNIAKSITGLSGVIFDKGKEVSDGIESVFDLLKNRSFNYKKFFGDLKNATLSDAKGTAEALKEVLLGEDGIGTSFSKFVEMFGQVFIFSSIADGFLKISLSLLAMAASVKILGEMDYGQIIQGMLGIGVAMVILGSVGALLSKIGGNMPKHSRSLLMLALSVKVLVSAVKDMKALILDDADRTIDAMNAIFVMMLELTLAAKMLAYATPELAKFSLCLINLALGVKILVSTLGTLSDLLTNKADAMRKAMEVIAGLMLGLVASVVALSFIEAPALRASIAMLALAASITVLAFGMQRFINLANQGPIVLAGFVAMGEGLRILAKNLILVSIFSKHCLAAGASFLLMAAAVGVLSFSLKQLLKIPWTGLAQSIVEMGIALKVMAWILNSASASATGMLSMAVSMGILSLSLVGLAAGLFGLEYVMERIMKFNWKEIWSVSGKILVLVGVLTAAGLILGALSELLVAAAVGVGAFGVALLVMLPALLGLEKIDLNKVGDGLFKVAEAIGDVSYQGFKIALTSGFIKSLAISLTALSGALWVLNKAMASSGTLSKFINSLSLLSTTYSNSMAGLKEDMVQNAKYAVDGFIDEIDRQCNNGTITKSGNKFAQAFLDGVRADNGGLGIHSPSKEGESDAKNYTLGFATCIGASQSFITNIGKKFAEWFTGGSVAGLTAGTSKDIKPAVKDVSNAVIKEAYDNEQYLIDSGTASGDAWIDGFKMALANRGKELTDAALSDIENLDVEGMNEADAITEWYLKNRLNSDMIQDINKDTDTIDTSIDTSSLESSATEVEDAFKSMRDSIKSSISVFSEFSEAEKVTADQLLVNLSSQLTGVNNWANSFSLLSAKGFNEGVINKVAEMGTESYGVIQGLLDMSDAYVKIYNVMFNESEKLADSTIDKIKIAVPALTQEVATETGKTIALVGHATDETNKAISGTVSNVNKINLAIDKLGNVTIPDTTQSTTELNDAMKDSAESASDLNNELENQTDIHNELTDSMEDSTKVTESQIDVNNEYKDSIDSTAKAELKVIEITKDLVQAYVTAQAKMNIAMEDFRTSLEETIASSVDIFDAFDFTSELSVDDMLTNIKTQRNGLQYFANGIVKMIEMGFDQGVIDKVKDMGQQSAFQYIAGFLQMTDSQVSDFNDTYKQVLSLESSTASAITDSYKDAGFFAIENYIEGVDLNQENVRDALELIGQIGIEGLVSTWEAYEQAGLALTNNLANGMSDNTKNTKEASTKVTNSITDTLEEELKKEKIAQFGEYVTLGLAQGITSTGAMYELMKSVKQVAKVPSNVFADYNGIKSPSRLFYKYGMYIDEGLANGIYDYARNVLHATEGMAEDPVNAMSTVISKITDAVNTDMDTNPVITPVLDLTEIQNGSSRLDSLLNGATVSSIKAKQASISYEKAKIEEVTGTTTPNGQAVAYNFTQNNYSPKALDRIEIYRQTNNQFSRMKGLVQNA